LARSFAIVISIPYNFGEPFLRFENGLKLPVAPTLRTPSEIILSSSEFDSNFHMVQE